MVMISQEGKSLLFCEQKRSKKNFAPGGVRLRRCPTRAKRSKSLFGSFSSEKELLS
jgi:hypothetical protein